MIARPQVWFLLLALAPLPLHAANATNQPPANVDAAAAAVAGAVSPAPDGAYDISDFSDISTHTITLPGAPKVTPEAVALHTKSLLLNLARRLVQVQQKTSDPQIKAIIGHFGLADSTTLAAMTPAATDQLLGRVGFSLLHAAETDPLAAQVAKEFQFSSGPLPPPAHVPAPATTPATNAPPAGAA
jgi:hypothetical protein